MLAPRGVKVTQRRQVRYQWAYLLLTVEPQTGKLQWRWLQRFNQDHLRTAMEGLHLTGVVWDGAGAHKGKRLADLPAKRVFLPPYSPELNPAERVFEEVRRHGEGVCYAELEAKQHAVEAYLRELAAEPERVKRLCNWSWIEAALRQLPATQP